jgi:hypothetical protein
MSAYGIQFLFALFMTVLIEVPVLFLFIRKLFDLPEKKIPLKRLVFFGFLASFATIPYLWFVLKDLFSYSLLTYGGRWIFVILAEASITLFEATIYYFSLNLSLKRAFAVSFACNAASFLIGLIVNALI